MYEGIIPGIINIITMNFILIFILTFLVAHLLTHVKFTVTKIPVNEAPKELRDAWMKRHPARAWKLRLAESFSNYVDDYNKEMTWWRDHIKSLRTLEDAATLIRIKKTVFYNLDQTREQLKKMGYFNIWLNLKVFRVSPDDLVRKKFGKNLEELYLCSYLLKQGKNVFNDQLDVSDDDIILSWRSGFRIPRMPAVFSNGLLASATEYATSIVYPKKVKK